MSTIEIFSPKARRRQRKHVQSALPADRWILDRMSEELLERWIDCKRDDRHILLIGCFAESVLSELRRRGIRCITADPGTTGASVQCDEDFLPFAPGSFDAILSVGTFDTVNDLPGALTLARRALRSSGLFLGAFLGVGTFPLLKNITAANGSSVARTHPLIDVRAAGDLLTRAGFASSVADTETVIARYATLRRLIEDARANGAANALAARFAINRSVLGQWQSEFERHCVDDGKAEETFAPIYLTGFAPEKI